MADEHDNEDRTLDASPRRREEALKEGRGAKSVDLSAAIVWIAALSVFTWLLPPLFNSLVRSYRYSVHRLADMHLTTDQLPDIFKELAIPVLSAFLPILCVITGSAVVVWLLQVGWNPNVDNLMPKWERLNPVAALQRLFSFSGGGGMMLVGILKLGLVGGVAYLCVAGHIKEAPSWHRMDALHVFIYAGSLLKSLCWAAALALLFIGAVDFGFQFWKFEREIRMTPQELKEEHKQEEGDPHIKAKIRQIQRARAMKRMMQDVPTATVVIMNPTHFAVALKYDPVTHPTPKVIAKGQDLVALRIKGLALEHGVQVLEDPPLARALYKAVQIDQEIPPEFYRAIAQVLATVLRNRARVTAPVGIY